MPTPAPANLSSVLTAADRPCVSIYLPAGRPYPENRQDAIRFKNLVRAAEEALAKTHPGPAARDVTAKLHSLQDDDRFWADTGAGVAVLASPDRVQTFRLPRTVPERVEVGESFHVKPLIRYVQSADRFHVLGVSRERVAVFEGNRYELHPVDVPGLPLTRRAALDTPADLDHVARPALAGTGLRGDRVTDGRGERDPEQLPLADEYFRAVDRTLTSLVSNPSGLPVILMGIDENLSTFRGLTKNRFVAADAVHGDWTNWTLPEIREKAWGVFQKHYLARLAAIREDFGTAAARNLATPDLVDAAAAVVAGRVGTLLIDADKALPGSIEMTTGLVRPAGPADAQPGDMLDDLAELGLRHGSTVTVVPSDQMPSSTGVAAIFRF